MLVSLSSSPFKRSLCLFDGLDLVASVAGFLLKENESILKERSLTSAYLTTSVGEKQITN